VLVVALVAVSCSRAQGAGSNATPQMVYGAGVSLSDVRGLLGSNDWWQQTPTFIVRPLDLPDMPENLRFGISLQFVHLGTAERLSITSAAYTPISDATARITNVQSQNSNTTTSPKVGDQSVYYGFRSFSHTALYSTFAIARQWQVDISVDLEKDSGFADISLMGRIAGKAVSRLKDVLSGKAHPSPLAKADKNLLPPAGTDVTLVGSTRLPIETLVASLSFSAPQSVVDNFHQLGVVDFLYADFALNADLTMEVKANLLTFPSASEANAFINAAVGAANLDATGTAVGYSAASGQYYGFFLAGEYVGIVFCATTQPGASASRACEQPFTQVIAAWEQTLTR